MRRTGTFTDRERRGHLPSAGNEKQDGKEKLRAVQESAVENQVKPFQLKDELVVRHRHECLRVPASPAP